MFSGGSPTQAQAVSLKPQPWRWGHPRVLVEHPDEAAGLEISSALRFAGYAVAVCPGPPGRGQCPLTGPEGVMARFVGAENVERGRDYLEQLDPELHRYIIDFVYGEVYAGDALDPKTRALCTVAMLATLGQQLQLGVYVQAARRRGATEQEIREVLRQVAVYAGFPNAWNALATMKAALKRFDETGQESQP
jgi:4-carboxymuconolactone decarboxylase